MITQSVQCDECKIFFQMDVEHAFSVPIFQYPSHWFLFGYRMSAFDMKWEASLCSWQCTKQFVDRMYEKHSLEDKLCENIVAPPAKQSDF